MSYLKLDTHTRTTIAQIRAQHPQVSIPEGADLTELGYAPLEDTEPPAAPDGHVVEPSEPEEVEGVWRTTWIVREMTAAEKSASAAARIKQIEDETGIVRILREATILQLESWATAQGYPLEAFRAANKGYRLLKETDEFITTLRTFIL